MPAPPRSRLQSLITGARERASRAGHWWRQSRPGQTLALFSARGGSLLAAGIAYSALFSLFAAATIGSTVLLWLSSAIPAVADAVARTLNSAIPGLVATGGHSGLLDPTRLSLRVSWSVAGITALVILIWSALALVRAVRSGLQAIAAGDEEENPPLARSLASDLATAGALSIALLVTAAIESASLWASAQGASLTGPSRWLAAGAVWLAAFALAAAVDGAVCFFLYRVVAGLPAGRQVWQAALGAALALGVVRQLGVGVAAGAVSNPLLAPFAIVITLLAWTNLVARLTLMGAAWAARPA